MKNWQKSWPRCEKFQPKFLISAFILLLLFTFSTIPSPEAHATLGGSIRSIRRDRHALKGRGSSIRKYSTYTVHEFKSGMTEIKEYASKSGVVFAVAWQGKRYPDLETLLGSYSPIYEKAMQENPHSPGSRRGIKLELDKLVVETWGIPARDIQGLAYDPALVPQGVNVHELR